MTEVFFDIHDANPGDEYIYLQIKQAGRSASVPLEKEAALIIKSSIELYKALLSEYDFVTPAEESIKMQMDALDLAEGKEVGSRWNLYKTPKRYYEDTRFM